LPQRIFVTGGSGFVGRHLISELLGHHSAHDVVALVRSEQARATVESLGARAVEGSLEDNVETLAKGMAGCGLVFHCAASVKLWGDWERDFVSVNIRGTQKLLDAAKASGVRRFLHVSSEAVLVGSPIQNADETQPYSPNIHGYYPRSKMEAEKVVLAANCDELETVIIRPRFIWGKGDNTLLPKLVKAVRDGQFKWFNGGEYLISTTHIANCVEGAILAAEKGRGGEIYHLTDGKPQQFKDFISLLLRTQDIDPSTIGSIPTWVASSVAWATEKAFSWFSLKGEPPILPSVVALIGTSVTISDAKARRELGYQSHFSIEAGIQELEEESQKATKQSTEGS